MLGNKIIFLLSRIVPDMNFTGINQKRLYEIKQGLSVEIFHPKNENCFVFAHQRNCKTPLQKRH
jgi:hypothetical protein